MDLYKTVIMATAIALGVAASGCGDESGDAPIIGKPDVTVVDGAFTPELLNSLGRVGDVRVSPDGKQVLYGVTYYDIAQNKGNCELHVMNIDGSDDRAVTHTPSSEGCATWIDGGKRIAFTYKDGERTQLWVMNADGSGRKCLTELAGGVDGFVFSPDETHVVLISQVKYGKTAQDHHPDLEKANARIIDDLMYKHWDEWVSEVPHPFVADWDGNAVSNVKDVLEGEPYESPMKPWGGIESLAWSADGKSLIYVCRKKVGKEYAVSTNSDLYRYSLADGKTENLTEGMLGYDTCPIVNKAGQVAWLSMEHDGYEADKNRIMLMDADGGNRRDLTADWDYSVDEIAWSPDGKHIFFIAPYQGTAPLFRLDTETLAIDTIASGTFDYAGLAVVDDNTVLTLQHNYARPNEVVTAAAGKEPAVLTHVNDDLLGQLAEITITKEMVPTTDGKQMTTWVVLPPNFDPAK